MVSLQMNICSLDFIYKVVNAYYEYQGNDREDWYRGIQTEDFRNHLVDRWGFDFWNQTNHLKKNYANWMMAVEDEQKYTLFLLRY